MSQNTIEKIRFGMTASLIGRYAYPGKQALAGVQAWMSSVNSTGGIAMGDVRLPVELVHYDDESSPQRCQELTRRLVNRDGVDMLLGPYSSGLAMRAAKVALEHGHVLWNHGGALGSRTQGMAVDILSPAATYFHGVVDYARGRKPDLLDVAIVHSTAGEFPRQVASGALEYCSSKQLPLPSVITYAADTKSFNPVMQQLRQQPPDLLLAVGRIEDDIAFARQLREAQIDIAFVGLIAAPLASFGDQLGDAAEGFLGPSQWESAAGLVPDYGPTSAEVIGHLADIGLRVPDYPAAQAYAGCLVAQRCIEEVGSLDAQALWEFAGQLEMTTFYGKFRINPNTGRQEGHVMPVIQWCNGQKIIAWPPQTGVV